MVVAMGVGGVLVDVNGIAVRGDVLKATELSLLAQSRELTVHGAFSDGRTGTGVVAKPCAQLLGSKMSVGICLEKLQKRPTRRRLIAYFHNEHLQK